MAGEKNAPVENCPNHPCVRGCINEATCIAKNDKNRDKPRKW